MKSCPFMAPHSTVKIAWHGHLRTRRKSCFYGPAWRHVCCLLHGPPKSSMWYDSCLYCCWSVNQLQRRAGAQSRSWRTAQERISDLFPPLSDCNLVCGLTHLWDHKTNITCSPQVKHATSSTSGRLLSVPIHLHGSPGGRQPVLQTVRSHLD